MKFDYSVYFIQPAPLWNHAPIYIQISVILLSVDSILMVEEGFDVTSVDASDKMLKYALKLRWLRRKEPAFDKWGKWQKWW